MECYAAKTATFMILGDTCTRGCRFCSVRHGTPRPVDTDEPRRVAEAARQLGLRHVVITCVTRDDLPDGGAEHFCRTIAAVRGMNAADVELGATAGLCGGGGDRQRPLTLALSWRAREPDCDLSRRERELAPTIEVLPSDFAGNLAAVDRLIEAAPEVYNHNTETVPRLFSTVRNPRADYRWTLEMFRHIHSRNPAIVLKTGLMLGLGETTGELLDTLADLFDAGCRILTLGQYLQPAADRLPVARYVPPEEFDELGRLARQMGFREVASGPFVRSSYHAQQMAAARAT